MTLDAAPLTANSEPVCLVLGVTGGVASGKSTLTRWFEEWGAGRVSADDIARELLAPGSGVSRAVISEFGDEIAEQGTPEAVNRRKLAQLIYADQASRQRLGEMMHPLIRRRMRELIEQLRSISDCRLIAVEIPLLYENGLEALVDSILVANCSKATQRQRLLARQPWLTASDALKQVHSQLPLAEKARRANYVISTEKPMQEVKRHARELFNLLARHPDATQG